MPQDELLIKIKIDDAYEKGFTRLEQRLKRLSSTVQELSKDQVRLAVEQTKLQQQEERRKTEEIRQTGKARDEEFRRESAQMRERTQAQSRAHRLEIEGIRERRDASKRQADEERDLRRERIRADQDARKRQERIDKDAERRRREERVHQQVLRREIERTGQARLRAFGQSLGRGDFGGLAGQFTDAALAVEGFGYALVSAGTYIVNTASDYDRLNRALTAITGNAADARSQLEAVEEIARLPGISFQDASRTSLRLRASGFDEATANRLITEFGNAAQVSGARFADAAEALRQLVQIQSTGRFTAENFNLILERLPVIRGVALRAFGTTVGGDIQKALEAQGKTFDDAIQMLLSGLENIDRVSADSFDNAVSNLGNDLNALAREVGEGLLPIARELVEGLATLVRFLSTDFGGILRAAVVGLAAGRGIQAVTDTVGGLPFIIGESRKLPKQPMLPLEELHSSRARATGARAKTGTATRAAFSRGIGNIR